MTFVRTVKTTSKTGESYEYLYIVESYWEKGKLRQRIINQDVVTNSKIKCNNINMLQILLLNIGY